MDAHAANVGYRSQNTTLAEVGYELGKRFYPHIFLKFHTIPGLEIENEMINLVRSWTAKESF